MVSSTSRRELRPLAMVGGREREGAGIIEERGQFPDTDYRVKDEFYDVLCAELLVNSGTFVQKKFHTVDSSVLQMSTTCYMCIIQNGFMNPKIHRGRPCGRPFRFSSAADRTTFSTALHPIREVRLPPHSRQASLSLRSSSIKGEEPRAGHRRCPHRRPGRWVPGDSDPRPGQTWPSQTPWRNAWRRKLPG